ncbi:hypothetical protein Pmani_019318 [Petrolisthes manimaculis]|uniref:Peptidase S1 domain-containing protein n=1 Tax=Petrolisthes manimaculis TaxID=1843537 RepID=A0AAE1PKR1_9EUCA|nr:hypothetical protein Pmani_019318 [Petrolisthes manimaculis]
MVQRAVMWILVVMAAAAGVGAQQDGGSWWLDLLANSTAATPIDEKVYCECVPYYQCVNGTITTSGVGLLDVRIGPGLVDETPRITNVDKCPGFVEICCGLPIELTITTTEPPRPTLPPDTPCECVSLNNCTEEKLVSDGHGNMTLDILGIGGYWHSKCPQAFAVCCALDPINTTYPDTQPHTTSRPDSLQECECVVPQQCGEDGYIITDGTGLLDIRIGTRDSSSQSSCLPPSVCCLLPPHLTQPPITTQPPTTQPPTTTQASVYSCGNRNTMGVKARILGFSEGESQFGEFPWMAAILNAEPIMDKVVRRFVGGGSLIHPRFILTAAHKVMGQNINHMLVRVGEWDTQNDFEPYPYQDIQVQNVIIHENYNPNLLYHDVALLFLKAKVTMQSHINSICLAPDLQSVDISKCVINGWGLNGFDEGAQYQAVMKSLTLPIVEKRQCVKSLRTTRLGRYFSLHNSFLCAGGERGKDACTGDGGGPLACPRREDPNRYLLVGITAWGIGCGEDGIPGVYVNVPAHRDWVMAHIEAIIPTTTVFVPTTTNATVYNQFKAGGEENGDGGEEVRGPRQEERERRKEERQSNRRQQQEERRRLREERRRLREENRRQRGGRRQR